jgi:Zn-dependent protease
MTLPLPPNGSQQRPLPDDDRAGGRYPGEQPTPGSERAARDAWSLQIANLSGIPLRLHFTFLLLIVYFAVIGIGSGSGAARVLFLLGIFACVALHEYGHSLMAQRLGYKVRDIVLYPIGGVASIEGAPRARHELVIALAGPAVNVLIALLLALILSAMPGGVLAHLNVDALLRGDVLGRLLVANIMLVLFNMIPAFPMDGGRVLRAALALKMSRVRATQIAATVGQLLAIVFGAFGLGLFGNPPQLALALIALFVYFGAGQERQAEQSREVVEGVPVGAAMVRQFETLQVGDTLKRAADVLLATSQQDFPVVFGDEVVGVLSRGALLRGLAQNGETAYVSGAMNRDVIVVAPDAPLDAVLARPAGIQQVPILVMEDGQLIGMLTTDNVMEFLTLRQIARDRSERQAGQSRAA